MSLQPTAHERHNRMDHPVELQQPVTPPYQAPLDSHGRLLADVVCRSCGYTLRGLKATDHCPDCGDAVERSMRGDDLRYAEPRWLRTLATGCMLYAIGSILTLALTTAVAVAAMFMGAASGTSGMGQPLTQGFIVVIAVVGIVPALLTVVGAWLATTPDPAATEHAGVSIRILARVGFVLHMMSSPTQMYWQPATGPGAATSTWFQIVAMAGLGLGLLALVGWFLYFRYLARLAMRLPAPRLAQQLRWIAVWLLVSMLVMSVGGMTTAMLMPTIAPGGARQNIAVFLTIAGATTCASILFFAGEIWAIVVHFMLAARLRACVSPAAPLQSPATST